MGDTATRSWTSADLGKHIIEEENRAKVRPYDLTGNIIAYESGELENEDIIVLFQHLVDNGMAWTLQGHYGRTAKMLIEEGYVTAK